MFPRLMSCPRPFVLPALLQKLVGEFIFLIFRREIWQEIWWESCGVFWAHKIKAQKSPGKIWEHYS